MLADEGAKLEAGTIYVAPGEVHLKLGPDRTVTLDHEPPHLHRPSADELFRSLAEQAGRAGIGVVLTGMGDDGAEGLVALRRAGGRALGQDQATSAVFGMARAARDAGAAQELLPLDRLAEAIRRAVEEAPT
jgi:two-component system chemotaxis response regulator CheB